MNDHLKKCTPGYNNINLNNQRNEKPEDNDFLISKTNNRWDLMSFG